jgi:hypothetical protein
MSRSSRYLMWVGMLAALFYAVAVTPLGILSAPVIVGLVYANVPGLAAIWGGWLLTAVVLLFVIKIVAWRMHGIHPAWRHW